VTGIGNTERLQIDLYIQPRPFPPGAWSGQQDLYGQSNSAPLNISGKHAAPSIARVRGPRQASCGSRAAAGKAQARQRDCQCKP